MKEKGVSEEGINAVVVSNSDTNDAIPFVRNESSLGSSFSTSAPEERWRRWGRLFGHFLLGQVTLQFLTVLTGIFLIRWLSKSEYAQYSVAFGFQSLATGLIDMNFGASITALVGDRAGNPRVVGNYLRAARYHRMRMLFIGLIFTLISFPWFTQRHYWGFVPKSALLISIVAYMFCQGMMVYAVPIRLAGDLKNFYAPQILGGIGRIVFCFFLWLVGWLNGWSATWVTTFTMAFTGWMIVRAAKRIVVEPERSDPEAIREMFRYMVPLLPGIIFTVFQGQISLTLITLFGKTANVAEVGALGRIGQVFNLIGALNLVLFEPYISRIGQKDLLNRLLKIINFNAILFIAINGIAFLFPECFILLLGENYSNLRDMILIFVISGSIGCLAQSFWMISSVRKWIFWWTSWFHILIIVIVQINSIIFMHIDNTRGVLLFQLFTNIALLISQLTIAVVGYRRSRQEHQKS